MQACSHCKYENLPGTLLESASLTLSTRQVPLPVAATWSGDGTTRIQPHESVLFHVQGTQEPVVIRSTHRPIIVGRSGNADRLKPDVDLTPHSAYEKGVSRLHATLRREKETLTIEDMGSANGTYVNGQTLIPGQRIVLRHGDEVRLGELVATIHFR